VIAGVDHRNPAVFQALAQFGLGLFVGRDIGRAEDDEAGLDAIEELLG